MEGDTSGSETDEYYYSRSGAWLEKSEFEPGQYQFPEGSDGWNEKGRLTDNEWTRIFNLICGANFKTR